MLDVNTYEMIVWFMWYNIKREAILFPDILKKIIYLFIFIEQYLGDKDIWTKI